MVRNGDIARVALGRVPIGPNSLRVAESTVAILRAGGVPEQAVAWVVDVVGLYVSANAVEGSINAEKQAGGRDSRYYADVGRYFAALPADDFPVMAALAPFLMTGDGDERFRFGLQLLGRRAGGADRGLTVRPGRRAAGPSSGRRASCRRGAARSCA